MQIIENWSELHGTVRTVDTTVDDTPGGFVLLGVDVDASVPVAGFAHLLRDDEAILQVPRRLLGGRTPVPGDRVRGRFRLTRSRRAMPHVEHFELLPQRDEVG